MELNWSTFILEIINFLVLVWILKHFFYAPIQNVISARKKMVDENLDHANKLQVEAKKLQNTYENRLQEWGKEKEQKQKLFLQEIDDWKSHEQAKFLKTINEEKEKMMALEKQNITKIINKNAKEAMSLAGKFATKFLHEFADENLESNIIDKVIKELKNLSEEKIQTLKSGFQIENKIVVQSVYALNENLKKQLTQSILEMLGDKVDIIFTLNPELLAGMNIQIGSIFLKASLRDELKFFSEVEGEST